MSYIKLEGDNTTLKNLNDAARTAENKYEREAVALIRSKCTIKQATV